MIDNTMRRRLLMAGLGLAAGAACAPSAGAGDAPMPDWTATEKANVKLMKAFWAAWNVDSLDIDQLVAQYMAVDALVRWSDDTPLLNGATAAAAAAKASMPAGSRALITVRRLFAHGPMVAVNRVDVIRVPGQSDVRFDTAGVAFVKAGRIVEYTDYILR